MKVFRIFAILIFFLFISIDYIDTKYEYNKIPLETRNFLTKLCESSEGANAPEIRIEKCVVGNYQLLPEDKRDHISEGCHGDQCPRQG